MKKSLIHIIIANALYLILVAASNFILPKFTSVETYAAVKEYTLYITTYSTLLTFGYIQGAYLKYGGKEVKALNSTEVGQSVFSFFVFMLPFGVAISILGLFMNDTVVIVLGMGVLSTNYASFYQLFYQATGDFKSYGVALNASRVMTLAVYVLLIFVLRTDNAILYVASAPIIGMTVAIYLTVKLNKRIPLIKNLKFSLIEIKSNCKGGFILMMGDFVTKFFTSIDKWFVKALMDTFSFAMYSFAVSMENLVNTFMTPITVSMFNYFCKKPTDKEVYRLKEAALVYSFVIIAGAYPMKWILEHFMPEYIMSVSVMFFLFAAQGISTIIRGIYVNKYKAEGNQQRYLVQMISMLILAIVLNGVFYFILHSMLSFAIATLFTNLIWLIWCEIQTPEIRFRPRAIISIVILLVVYLVTGYMFDSIIGCLIYAVVGIITGITIMRDSFFYVVNAMIDMVKSKLGKEKIRVR